MQTYIWETVLLYFEDLCIENLFKIKTSYKCVNWRVFSYRTVCRGGGGGVTNRFFSGDYLLRRPGKCLNVWFNYRREGTICYLIFYSGTSTEYFSNNSVFHCSFYNLSSFITADSPLLPLCLKHKKELESYFHVKN
jgi:hypothetical protein